jgi:Tat protein secretion system quality control protein TatD with DNase activity
MVNMLIRIILPILNIVNAIQFHREMIEVNNNYLDWMNDNANQQSLHESRLKPKGFKDTSLVGAIGETGMDIKLGLDLKDEVQLRVNLES